MRQIKEDAKKDLQNDAAPVKLSLKDGWLVCPRCRRNRHLMRIRPETRAENLQLFCRDCKSELIVNIDKGQCYESRSQ